MPRNIFQPIEIITYRTDHLVCPLEGNTFFEIAWVEVGDGFRIVGDHQLPFSKGTVFLHLPSDENLIHLNSFSVIHFIKFQKAYFDLSAFLNESNTDSWFSRIEFILFSNKNIQENVAQDERERRILIQLIQTILYESQTQGNYFDSNIRSLLTAVLNIIARNIGISGARQQRSIDEGKDILTYIHYHISDAEKLRVRSLADVFNISPSYFGEYFKNKYGITLRKYILEYKLNLAENRLTYTNDNISQIADYLQFQDAGHFTKTFKRHRGKLPSNLRA